MTLKAEGRISFSELNVELGRASTSNIAISAAETQGTYGAINTFSKARPNLSRPSSISEWYGYNHRAKPPIPPPTLRWELRRDGTTTYAQLRIMINGVLAVNATQSSVGTIPVADGNVLSVTVSNFRLTGRDAASITLNADGLPVASSDEQATTGLQSITYTLEQGRTYTLAVYISEYNDAVVRENKDDVTPPRTIRPGR
jgi:hypothetical protein